MKRLTKHAAVVAGLMLVSVFSAQAAYGSTTGYYYGLLLKDSAGHVIGELDATSYTYNKNLRLENDPSGSKQQIEDRHKDRYSNGQQIYVKVTFWDNGNYCLDSNDVSVSAGPKGQPNVAINSNAGCSSGWNINDTVSSSATSSTSWQYWYYYQWFEVTADSGKGDLRLCEDEPAFTADDCTGPRSLGSDF